MVKAKAKYRVDIRIIRADGTVESINPPRPVYRIKIFFKEVIKRWLQFIPRPGKIL